MYNGWGSIYWDSSVGDTAAWGLYLQSPPNVGVADQPLVDEFTTNYIVGGEALCLAPNFDNYTSEMGAISGITSPSNGSAEFNGTSDYIETPNLSIQSSATWTIGVWVYSDWTSSGADYLFDGREGASDGFSVYTNNGTTWTYYDNNGGATTGSNFVTNDWYYLTIVRDGSSSVKVYKDGSLTDTLTGLATSYDVTGPFRIGARFTTLENYQGNAANFSIWNRALTSDEINSVMWKQYEEISTSERNGLQAWYSLDSVDTFADWYTYAQNQGAVIEGRTCVDNALNALAQL